MRHEYQTRADLRLGSHGPLAPSLTPKAAHPSGPGDSEAGADARSMVTLIWLLEMHWRDMCGNPPSLEVLMPEHL
jgi:hypothetical protein